MADGIPVVLAQRGAVTSTDAFALDGIVAAGMFEYLLHRGGVSAGSENNWYLRSYVMSPPPPPPVGPITPTVRPEVPNDSLAPTIGRELGLAAGTYHLRQGDQMLLVNRDPVSGAWGRAFGEKREQGSSQVVSGTDFDLQLSHGGLGDLGREPASRGGGSQGGKRKAPAIRSPAPSAPLRSAVET